MSFAPANKTPYRVAVVVPPSSSRSSKNAATKAPRQSRRRSSNLSSVSPDPLTTNTNHNASDQKASDPRNAILSAPRKAYVPGSIPPPRLTNGPSTASPTYDQEHIVERVYRDDVRFDYRVARRLRAPKHRRIESLASPSSSDDTSSPSARSGSQPDSFKYFLVAPEDILDNVSAADLETFENQLAPVQARQKLETKRWDRRLDIEEEKVLLQLRAQQRAMAKAQGLDVDMRDMGRRDVAAFHDVPMPIIEADTPIVTTESGRGKRKAGVAALDRLAATPWTQRAVKQQKFQDSLPSTPSSMSRVRGRPKSSGKLTSKVTNGFSRTNANGGSSASSVSDSPAMNGAVTEDAAGLRLVTIIEDRKSITNRKVKEYLIEEEGIPGARWVRGRDLPKELVQAYEVEYVVESIVGDTMVNGKRLYEVAWVGYPGQNTFESAGTLGDDWVEEYHDRKRREAVTDSDNASAEATDGMTDLNIHIQHARPISLEL